MSSVQYGTQFTRFIVNTNEQEDRYSVSNHTVARSKRGSLVDRGANGGIIGNDAIVIHKHQREVDVTGIDNHELNSLPIIDASAKVTTQRGDVIVIMKQYAYHGIGRLIHSAGQVEHYKNMVFDRSMKVGGTQCMRTSEGYVIPLDIINGLPYMKMVPNSKAEFAELPHVILTSGADWDPKVLDHIVSDTDNWYNTIKEMDDGLIETPFDQFGNYRHREPTTNIQIIPEQTVQKDFEISFHEAFALASDQNQRYICYEHDGNTIDYPS